MLAALSVREFGLIESVSLEFESGMTVFTGETGAGKSMLIDALGAVFGARARSDWVRHGAERAEVTAIWEGEDARIDALLEEGGIERDEQLILRRIVGADGRSRAFLNGVPVALKTLQQLGEICLDLHGQHEHQSLMQESVQQRLLDATLEAGLKDAVACACRDWSAASRALDALTDEQGESERQAGWMREELARLEALAPEAGVIDQLQAEVDSGRHHAQIQQAAVETLMLLDEGEPNVREMVARAAHAVSAAESYHDGLRSSRELLDQIEALLGEAVPELSHVLDQSFDEAALHEAEQRLMGLHETMRRHACDEQGLCSLMEEWQARLSGLETAAWDREALQERQQAAASAYREAAAKLSAARVQAGALLSGKLRPFLDRLALAGMQVRFSVQSEQEWRSHGWDRVHIEVMSNPGEPWRALSAVASGGELSRLVLAFKGSGALDEMPHIAVFDEVDTGIGGETAWCVGELLQGMSASRQVLVISHLPQVAACADHQVVIRKGDKSGRTVTHLSTVAGEGRLDEIARMLGGVDTRSLEHAGEMLERGRTVGAA